jgi:hypothetical protein
MGLLTGFLRRCARRARAGSRAAWCAVLMLLMAQAGASPTQGPTPEYQLKAVFLFNFAQFVEWPVSAFPDRDAPLVIGILGDDPFGAYLDETVRGERVNDHPLVVKRFRRVEDIEACHILFVSEPGKGRLKPILDSLDGRSVLTVSDVERFAARGGMIGFVTEQHRIRLRINLAAAKAADLTISSKLLRPSEIVSDAKD